MREYPAFYHIQEMDIDEFMMLLDIRRENNLRQEYNSWKVKNKSTISFEKWCEVKKDNEKDDFRAKHNMSKDEYDRLQRLNV